MASLLLVVGVILAAMSKRFKDFREMFVGVSCTLIFVSSILLILAIFQVANSNKLDESIQHLSAENIALEQKIEAATEFNDHTYTLLHLYSENYVELRKLHDQKYAVSTYRFLLYFGK